MIDPSSIILAPVVTEKATDEKRERGTYVFKVSRCATKVDIRMAVEKLFKVKVKAVNTARVRGKRRILGRTLGRTSSWKKAFVTLKPGQKIEMLEGII